MLTNCVNSNQNPQPRHLRNRHPRRRHLPARDPPTLAPPRRRQERSLRLRALQDSIGTRMWSQQGRDRSECDDE